MQVSNIKNVSTYSSCTHYFKSSAKYIKSMRIAQSILGKIYPNHLLSHCEAIFPNHDSNLTTIQKLGVNIVCEKSTMHENRIYFAFYL